MRSTRVEGAGGVRKASPAGPSRAGSSGRVPVVARGDRRGFPQRRAKGLELRRWRSSMSTVSRAGGVNVEDGCPGGQRSSRLPEGGSGDTRWTAMAKAVLKQLYNSVPSGVIDPSPGSRGPTPMIACNFPLVGTLSAFGTARRGVRQLASARGRRAKFCFFRTVVAIHLCTPSHRESFPQDPALWTPGHESITRGTGRGPSGTTGQAPDV